MKTNQEHVPQIAASLDLPESLAPFASQLMQGIDALGSYPAETITLCRKAGINQNSSVLDLACGKGVILVELASQLGCGVRGVDISSEFIHSAQARARAQAVRARFVTADVLTLQSSRKFDVVIMLNLFPMEEALDFCRECVRPGGLVIFDDVTLASGKKDRRWLSLGQARKVIEGQGVEVVAYRQVSAAKVNKAGLGIEHQVAVNGQKLASIHPRLRRSVAAYLKRLKGSRRLLTTTLRPTIFAAKIAEK